MKIKNLHIKEFKGLRDISINFEKNDEPLDLVVLAGSNGSGKTRILESILDYFNIVLVVPEEAQNKIELFFESMEEKCIDKLGHELSFKYCLKFGSKEKKISVGSVGARYLDINI